MAHKYMDSFNQSSNFSQSVLNSFKNLVEEKFEEASDVFTIQEEKVFGSGVLSNVVVRINRGIDMYTGQKLGDDYKLIIFKDDDHDMKIGSKFYFDNNYWLVNNTELTKNLANSIVVKRCNNVLKWCDENGVVYEEPCSIEVPLKRPVDSEISINPMTPEGFIELFAQLNSKTELISPNQRFIFGNSNEWACYKIYGGGVKHFMNINTFDNSTSRLIYLSLGTNYINKETDDLVNGIADYYKNIYEIIFSPQYLSGSIGNTYQLSPTILLNGLVVSKDIQYLSSASSIVNINGSGVVDLLSSGSAIIVASLNDNTLISGSISIQVSSSAVSLYDIRISPLDKYIYEGQTNIFTTYAYSSGSILADTFSFSVANNNVPTENYILSTINGNSFSIKNNEFFLDYPLEINILGISGSISVNFELRGAW